MSTVIASSSRKSLAGTSAATPPAVAILAMVSAGCGGDREPAMRIRLLGPTAVDRNGERKSLPPSRKVRALLAFLALSGRPVSRSRLCDLLWDAPDDPRGELRWCLSKLRRVLDEPHRRRVKAEGDTVALDLSACFVDAVEIASVSREEVAALDLERLRTLSQLYVGELLEGLNLDDSPAFMTWLVAERHRLRDRHVSILERLVERSTGAELLTHLRRWLELAPFDPRPHETLLAELARARRIAEGEEHVGMTVRLFEAEGLDAASIRAAWRSAKGRASSETARMMPRRFTGTSSARCEPCAVHSTVT